MNKYEILEGKLTAINAYIDTMCLESNATMEYLKQYKEYVNELIIAIQNRTIRNSKALKRLCQEHQKEMPTQIKLVYDVISDRINADYSYDIIFSDDQNKTAYDVLDEWYQLEKSNEK